MTRKQIIWVAVLVLVTSTLSALLAYRLALRRAARRVAASAVAGSNKDCVDFRQAGAHTGEEACISGRVLHVFVSRAGNAFLDFCADYRECPFTSVIFSSDLSKFGDLQTLRGRQVEIRGPVTVYNGRAEIIIHGPDQIRAAE